MKYLSLFSGIGGFELGIQQAYEQLCNANGSEERRSQEDKERNKRQRLLTEEVENISSERRPASERFTDGTNERPLCIGYSEIDKYAIQIYQKHFGNIPRTKEEIENDLDYIKTITSKNNYDIMEVCYVNNVKKETSFIKTTSQSVKTALDDTSLTGVKKILSRVGQRGENIMLCEDKECSICMGEDVSVVANLKNNSLPLNIKTEMDTLTERDMELAICIKSPLKIINQINTKSFATTVITLKDDIIYAHIKRTKGHFNFGDITKINPAHLPDFDALFAGFPCQSFSIAGKRRGFADTRGTMFFEIARILKEKQPRLFLLENVKGLLSHDNGDTFRTIITTLDELGYDMEWQVLNSKNFGVPQNRERVFIVGHLRGTSRPKVFPITGGNPKNLEQLIGGHHGISTTIASQAGGQGAKTGLYATGIDTGGLQTVATSIDANYHKGHGQRGKSRGRTLALQDTKIRRLTPTECERLQGFPDGWTEGVSDTQRYKTLGNAVTVNVIKAIAEILLQSVLVKNNKIQ